jgi:cell division protein FtsN
MAKDFVKKKSVRHHGRFSRQLLLVVVCFLSGYVSASLADLASVTDWIKTHLLSQQTTTKKAKPAAIHTQLPKPKLEFYTLLAKDHQPLVEPIRVTGKPLTAKASSPSTKTQTQPISVPTTNTTAVLTKPPPEPAKNTKGSYFVQVAAFKNKKDADKMRASWVLKGFVVTVSTVHQNSTDWFRVNLGPFSSHPEAKKAQSSVARSEHIIGMIRKMDA